MNSSFTSSFTIPRFTLPAIVARIGARLPQFPHALSLVCSLNLARKLGVMPVDTLADLEGRTFRVSVLDTGGVADFTVSNGIFKPLIRFSGVPDLHFSANLSAFLQLLSRQEDPDTLFFNRQLTIEGDTELGLLVKNMLDAIDWSVLSESLSRLPIPGLFKSRFSSAH
jgi:O2-independent ubiquinone biosynthesis accessory factor UbiT